MQVLLEVTLPDTALLRGEGEAIAAQELVAAVEYAVHAIQGAVVPLTPVGVTGHLRQGTQTRVDVGGSAVDVTGHVFNPLGYAPAVERGARPHFPPPGALELWVQRKLGVPANKARSVAFVVARAIARRGTAGAAMFWRGVESVEASIHARFDQVPGRIIARLGK